MFNLKHIILSITLLCIFSSLLYYKDAITWERQINNKHAVYRPLIIGDQGNLFSYNLIA